MEQRILGRAGPAVSAIGLGCMSLGIADVYTSSVSDDDAAVALIHRALDLGITLLDTADIYGVSEMQVGKALRGRRADAVLATKFGFVGTTRPGVERIPNGSPDYVRRANRRRCCQCCTNLILR
jgi:aryl-alcohol dehydrogenase-like predicted oxidoreductase